VNATQFQAATTVGGAGVTLSSAITSGVLVDPGQHLYLSLPYHGMQAGSTVTFTSLSGGAGLSNNVRYYAASVETNRFKVMAGTTSTTPVVFTTDVTAGSATIPPPRIEFGTQYGLTTSGTQAPNASVSIADGKINSVNVLYGGDERSNHQTEIDDSLWPPGNLNLTKCP